MAASFEFCCNMLHITYFRLYSLGDACEFHMVCMHHMQYSGTI